MGSSSKVTLFPWDPNSDLHLKCLVSQRVECGWDQEKVEIKWKQQQLNGEKCIYWIVGSTGYYPSASVLFKPTTRRICLHFVERSCRQMSHKRYRQK